MQNFFTDEKINQSAFIDVKYIPFTEKAASYCQANLCGRYGKSWSCPPALGDFNTLMTDALKYDKAFVFSHKGYIESFSDEKAMDSLRDETTEILFTFCERLKEKNISHLALGCGSCNFCKECTYPHSPCRYPEKAIPPMEAYGIDVAALCEKTGMTYMADNNEVTFFCMILYKE